MTAEIDWRERALRAEAAYRACCEAAGMVYDGGEVYPVAEVAERIAFMCDRECRSCLDLSEQRDEARAEVLHQQVAEASLSASLAALRRDYTTLVRAHLHPSNDYRMRVFREAMARVEGWGM